MYDFQKIKRHLNLSNIRQSISTQNKSSSYEPQEMGFFLVKNNVYLKFTLYSMTMSHFLLIYTLF